MAITKAKDIKLVIQPVHCVMVHEYVFEGPCRFGSGDELTLDFDRMNGAEGFKLFKGKMARYLTNPDFELLEPITCEITEAFEITDELMAAVTANDAKADCYLFHSTGRAYPIMTRTAEMTGKPLVLCPKCCGNTMVPATIRARGLECESPMRWEDMEDILEVLRVRKVLRNTRALLLTRAFTNSAAVSAPDGFLNLDDVTKRFGTQFCFLDIHEFIDQTRPVACTDNPTKPGIRGHNLTAEDMDEIGHLADELMAGAYECTISKEDLVHTLRFYKTTKKLMDHYSCNAFSTACPEMCATRRLNENKYTPCLTHSLLNGEGICSACEYDIPGLLTQVILSSFARAGAYIGNTHTVLFEDDGITAAAKINPENGLAEKVRSFDAETRRNLVLTFHASINRQMKGYDAPQMEYAIHPYTGSQWGGTFRYDFAQDAGQVLTMARISPDGKSIFVARGRIVGSIGHDLNGCTQGVLFTVENSRDFYTKQCDFGNHVPLVYGDVFDRVVALGKLLGLNVVTA
ncbi:MAG: hypothetical protein ACI4PC_02860 [Oscillospiraceae bacterium]